MEYLHTFADNITGIVIGSFLIRYGLSQRTVVGRDTVRSISTMLLGWDVIVVFSGMLLFDALHFPVEWIQYFLFLVHALILGFVVDLYLLDQDLRVRRKEKIYGFRELALLWAGPVFILYQLILLVMTLI